MPELSRIQVAWEVLSDAEMVSCSGSADEITMVCGCGTGQGQDPQWKLSISVLPLLYSVTSRKLLCFSVPASPPIKWYFELNALRVTDTVQTFPGKIELIWYLGCSRVNPYLVIWGKAAVVSLVKKHSWNLCSFFLWLVSFGLRLQCQFMEWVRNASVEIWPELPPTGKRAMMFVATCESQGHVPTTNHRAIDRLAQWYSVQKRYCAPASQECCPLTLPA